MHPYLKHLLQDIKNAGREEADSSSSTEPMSFEEQMKDVELYVSDINEQSLSYFTGLHNEDFPPSEQLTEEDMESVLQAFAQMLKTWNATIHYPEKMPCKARYEFLLNHALETEFTPVQYGHIGLDFCTGCAPDCEWGEYCTCLEYWNE